MASNEELQAYMKAASNEIEGPRRPCPGEAELLAYCQGQGDDSIREAIASHLSLCGKCRQALRDARDFLDPTDAGAVDLDREWSRFAKANLPARRKSGIIPWPRPALAWAAAFALVTLTGLLWTLRTQRQIRDELTRLEAENRSLRASRENDLAALTRPRLDAAIFDLYSRESRQRSGGKTAAEAVRLAPGAPAVFILNGEGQADYPAYAVELLDGEAKSLWRDEGLKRTQGSYVISFPPGFLLDGAYRLQVFGVRGMERTRIGEYDLRIAREP